MTNIIIISILIIASFYFVLCSAPSIIISVPNNYIGYYDDGTTINPGTYLKWPWTHYAIHDNTYHNIKFLISTSTSDNIPLTLDFHLIDHRWDPSYFAIAYNFNESNYVTQELEWLQPYIDSYMSNISSSNMYYSGGSVCDGLSNVIYSQLNLNGLTYDPTRKQSLYYRYDCSMIGDCINVIDNMYRRGSTPYSNHPALQDHSADWASNHAAYPLPVSTMIPDDELSPQTVTSQADVDRIVNNVVTKSRSNGTNLV